MFSKLFQAKKTNKPTTSQLEDDFVKFGEEDDDWEEISGPSSRRSPVVVAPSNNVIAVAPVPLEQEEEEEEDVQELIYVAPLAPVPVQEPAWKIELEKRDKTPYTVTSVSNDSYARLDNGLPYVLAEASQDSYVVPQNHHEPYALATVSNVAYVASYTVPKDTVEKNDIPYCVAY